jgi:predicted esterase
MGKTVTIGNTSDPSGVVIWMHGLADSPYGWSDFATNISSDLPRLKWLLPEAPQNPVTCSGGERCASWMDLMEIPITPDTPDNGQHLDASVQIIHAMVDQEIEGGAVTVLCVLLVFARAHVGATAPHAAGMDPKKIVIGGFSQGAALALASVLKYPQQLGGCVVYSGWALPLQNLAQEAKTSASKDSAFEISHGTYDNVVHFTCAEQVNTLLEDAGCSNLAFIPHQGMMHTSCEEQVEHTTVFLSKVCGKAKSRLAAPDGSRTRATQTSE